MIPKSSLDQWEAEVFDLRRQLKEAENSRERAWEKVDDKVEALREHKRLLLKCQRDLRAALEEKPRMDNRICHAPGERCLACPHYYGKAHVCFYAEETPLAWALRNSQGYWVGIWNDRETAEFVMSRQHGKGDRLIPVYAAAHEVGEDVEQ